jgi:hypothetical protein
MQLFEFNTREHKKKIDIREAHQDLQNMHREYCLPSKLKDKRMVDKKIRCFMLLV